MLNLSLVSAVAVACLLASVLCFRSRGVLKRELAASRARETEARAQARNSHAALMKMAAVYEAMRRERIPRDQPLTLQRGVIRRPVDGRAVRGPPLQLPPVERPNADAQQALKARLQAKHGTSNGNGSAAPATAPAAPEQRLSRGQRRRLRNQQTTADVVANVAAIDQRPPEVIRLAARYAKTP